MSDETYDAIIIGAGMSGLAAGIRLAMFDQRVVIVDRHYVLGGLNSFYSRYKRDFDVGLHAVTNVVPKGAPGRPLTKLLKQLRWRWDDLGLVPQRFSRITFPDQALRFTNDPAVLREEVATHFPASLDGYDRLRQALTEIDAFALEGKTASARAFLEEHLPDALLREMLLAPLLYYGSAVEDDMHLGQFAVMWQSIYEEGFGRPPAGVRHIVGLLEETYRGHGGEFILKNGVQSLNVRGDRVVGVVLEDGRELHAERVFSSAGRVETARLRSDMPDDAEAAAEGNLGFFESIFVLDCPATAIGFEPTIEFVSESPRFRYRAPEDFIDTGSAVLCSPGNFAWEAGMDAPRGGAGAFGPEGMLRMTCLAGFDSWWPLSTNKFAYRDQKAAMTEVTRQWLERRFPGFSEHIVVTDCFTPNTIVKYTGHARGCVYGSPRKVPTGETDLRNLFLMGTDQGFLGIIGSMLSGISIANKYGLATGG